MPTLLEAIGGKLVIATHNAGKLREIEDLLGVTGLSVTSAGALGLGEPEETGESFEENALIKARAAHEESGLAALADDSGLCVVGLDGAPGIHSARWAGPDKNFVRAMADIEKALAERGSSDRRAFFVAVLALKLPDGREFVHRGEVHGRLIAPRGTQGFGYDPIFLPDGHQRGFGEMSAEEKHGWRPGDVTALSHRARAFKLLFEALNQPA